MGIFIRFFIGILCISILLSITFPGSETQWLDDNLFSKFLQEKTDPITGERYYDNFNNSISPEWSEGGNQESSLLTKFLDGLSIVKTVIMTLINIAVVPLKLPFSFNPMPGIIRLLFFVPMALIYIISAIMTLIRGVNP